MSIQRLLIFSSVVLFFVIFIDTSAQKQVASAFRDAQRFVDYCRIHPKCFVRLAGICMHSTWSIRVDCMPHAKKKMAEKEDEKPSKVDSKEADKKPSKDDSKKEKEKSEEDESDEDEGEKLKPMPKLFPL